MIPTPKRIEHRTKNNLNQVYCFIVVFICIITLKRKILNRSIATMIYVIGGLRRHWPQTILSNWRGRCNDKEMENQ